MQGSWSTRSALAMALLTMVFLPMAGCRGVEAHPPSAGAETPGAQQLPFTGNTPLVVPANTAIYVRLQEPLSSATAQEGQNFSAVLDQPLVLENQAVAPEGSQVTGTVVAVRDSGRLHATGYLRITLTSITLNGKAVPLQTNSVFVGGDRKHNVAIVGNGAGGNDLLEALLGSGKGVTAGKLDGASSSAGKKQVGFAAEHRLGFRLTQPLNL